MGFEDDFCITVHCVVIIKPELDNADRFLRKWEGGLPNLAFI